MSASLGNAAPATSASISSPQQNHPQKKPRVAGSFAPPPPGDLLSHVTINHGPADFLGRFFLRADDLARSRGVSFSITTFDELMKLNEKHRATWMRMTSMYDPKFCPTDLVPEKSYVIFGRNINGEVVSCSAAKMMDLGESSLYDALTSLRALYENPGRDANTGEAVTCTAPIARSLRGRIFIGGAAWVRPDYRGRDIPGLSVRVSRAMALSKFGFDSYVSFLMDYRIQVGFDMDLGYPRGEWGMSIANATNGNPNTKVVWLYPDEVLADLRAYATRMEIMREESDALARAATG
ncbi:MAG: hypothetical protein RL291_842 [Pseudomonadota bacterium]